jgi:hypothetical protein
VFLESPAAPTAHENTTAATDLAGTPNRLLLRDSWHPLVPAPSRGAAFVRNDIVLGEALSVCS